MCACECELEYFSVWCFALCTSRVQIHNIVKYISVTIDGVRIGTWIYYTFTNHAKVAITLSLFHTPYNSLQHALHPLSRLCPHQ
jgi:hypothetical protein